MELHFDELIDRLAKFMEAEAKTETVIGDAFTLGEFSCIPVIRVGMGFGTGAGEGPGETGQGGGAGAGMGIEPIGFLVTRADQISFVATRTTKGLAAAFEKVPDLLTKYLESQKTTSTDSAKLN